MTLPGAERAEVEPDKVREYLLSASHPVGRFKAAFFVALGYSAERWEQLRDDLLAVARTSDAAAPGGPSPFGVKYEVRATLAAPAGRNADVLTVWIVLDGEDIPRFVTAFPA